MQQQECADPDDRHRPSHEVSARFKLCLDMLQAASVPKITGKPAVDSQIPANLPIDTLCCTVAGFSSAGGPTAPQHAQCDLRGLTCGAHMAGAQLLKSAHVAMAYVRVRKTYGLQDFFPCKSVCLP